MAYASIAGVPVQYGLYAVPLALVGYVVFGACRQLFVGPSATVASISAVAVAAASTSGTSQSQFIALSAALALMVGVIYILLGLARMGFVARFFAKPVLDGFIIGLGLYIAVGQFPKMRIDGVIAAVGEERVFPTVRAAVDAVAPGPQLSRESADATRDDPRGCALNQAPRVSERFSGF
jgi:MFS superfamily sulfate permease-like transporter